MMNQVYLIGMGIAMVIFIIIGFVISRKIRGAEDFYVAGRRAPVLLIAGSMIASYTSTGMFMGDAALCYQGAFTPIIMFASMQSAGYIIGAVFFGRYLRRSRVMTIPEFFESRFCSKKIRILSAVTAVIMMTVYLLSVMQGIGTLMSLVTGLSYNVSILISLAVIAFIAITSGSRGVLITDTLMASVFTLAMVAASLVIARNTGGWYGAIGHLAGNKDTSAVLSWAGRPGALKENGPENLFWGLTYGVVWMGVCMAGPWQSSRYQMAKNEHVVIRSSFYSAIGVFLLEFLAGITAVLVIRANPALSDSSHVMIFAAMNLVPTALGVVMLTGILSAGISSATTFLSLIGTSAAYDVFRIQDGKKSIAAGRMAMFAMSLTVLAAAVFNPLSIFWIMTMGGSIVAASWMPVVLASFLSKRVTSAGAFSGMLSGFLTCFGLRLYAMTSGISLPGYLDPSLVGMVLNVLAMAAVSALTRVTEEEKEARERLFIIPESEKDPEEIRKTLKNAKASVLIGVFAAGVLLVLWVIPYYLGLKK